MLFSHMQSQKNIFANSSLNKKSRLQFTEGGKKLMLGVAKIIIQLGLLNGSYTDGVRRCVSEQTDLVHTQH